MDKVGARPVVAVSALLIAFSYLLRPFMTELWHYYALSAIQFAGFPGAAMLPAARLVSIWFPEKRGRMMGITAMGANFGGVTMPAMASFIVMSAGWQWGFASLGIIGAGVAVASVLLVREAPATVSDGLEGPDEGRVAGVTRLDRSGLTVREAVHSVSFYAVVVGVLAATFTYPAVLTQLIPHLQNEGLPLSQAALYVSFMAIFGMTGKVLFGYLTERIPSKNVLTLSLVIQSLGLAVLITVPDTPLLWVALPVYGLALGGMGALFPLLVQDSFGMAHFGALFGLVNLATVGSALAGPLLVGVVFDSTGSYRLALLIVIGIYAVGAAALRLATPFRSEIEGANMPAPAVVK
jgi:MFS family permease